MTSKLSSLAVACVLWSGCATHDEGKGPETSDGFVLQQHTGSTIEASMADGDASLSVLVVEVEKDIVEITFDFGDPIISWNIDYTRGVADFMPAGGALDAAQARVLEDWIRGISAVIELDSEKQTRVEFVTTRMSSLMQIVPTGETLVAGSTRLDRGWTNISCSCFNQYIGSGYYRTCGKGCGCTGGSGNGCKGRCGQGCGITSSPGCSGNTSYTRDCAKHDYGLGSWWAASDDYASSSNNCSCSGVGTCY